MKETNAIIDKELNDWEFLKDVTELQKLLTFWSKEARKAKAAAEYYQEELVKSHALLGRVIHQLSERWDSVNLTSYFPKDNLHGSRTVRNPKGE